MIKIHLTPAGAELALPGTELDMTIEATGVTAHLTQDQLEGLYTDVQAAYWASQGFTVVQRQRQLTYVVGIGPSHEKIQLERIQ